MNPRHLLHLVLVASLAALLAACGDETTSNTPTSPTTPQITDRFNGTLTVNGAASYPFTVAGSGPVVATLTSFPSLNAVSLSLGTWSGSSCSITIANDAAFQGANVAGTASTGGAFCVRISDVGTLTEAVEYTITVTHY